MGELSSYIEAYDYIVPAARASIAKALVNNHNMSEKDAARILGVTQAAISKYISNKYSEKIKEIELRIDSITVEKYISQIIDGNAKHMGECICKICQTLSPFDCRITDYKEGNK